MPNTRIDIGTLGLDELGRVILSDDLLDMIEGCDDIQSAGANGPCVGTTNGACTNSMCSNSANGSCTNTVSCSFAHNVHCYDDPIE